MLILSKISKIMNKNWSNIQLCRQKLHKLDIEKWIYGSKWATISLFLIKKWVFTNEFLHFKGMWELWECQNWILDGFLSWKNGIRIAKSWKILGFLEKKGIIIWYTKVWKKLKKLLMQTITTSWRQFQNLSKSWKEWKSKDSVKGLG